jgi:hypothetical protein
MLCSPVVQFLEIELDMRDHCLTIIDKYMFSTFLGVV